MSKENINDNNKHMYIF